MNENKNKDGIPIYMILQCKVRHVCYALVTDRHSNYYTKHGKYNTIQEATKAITDENVDWKEFWKTLDGIPIGRILEQ